MRVTQTIKGWLSNYVTASVAQHCMESFFAPLSMLGVSCLNRKAVKLRRSNCARVATITVLLTLSLSSHRATAFDTPTLPDATASIAGSLVVLPTAGIRVIKHRGEWGAFLGSGGDGESYFLIAGQFENTSGKPLTYVKFQFELVNKEGVVVIRDFGYNRKAEALREEDYEKGKKSLTEMKIESLPAGAKEDFRFFFFKSDAPEFSTYRVRFLESR